MQLTWIEIIGRLRKKWQQSPDRSSSDKWNDLAVEVDALDKKSPTGVSSIIISV
jgi:hypothetical protein